jgi:serine/threonine protein kinase
MAFCALDRIHYNTHLPEVQRFTQKYFLKRTLIRGKYNAVACGYNKINHKKVVIKAVYQPEPRKFREVAILKKLQHIPGVIKYLDDYTIKCDIQFLVMEHFGQMNLQFFLSTNGSVSEHVAHTIFKQLFKIVQSCFQNHILHRKINPNNILIDVRTNQIKVANFNSASQFDSEEFTSQLSNEIAPPEYFLSKKYTAGGLYAWSLGLILYELLFNIKPFNLPIDVINSPLVIPPHKQTLSLDVITFLNWLLAKSDRITLNQIAHHPWITKQWI